MLHGILYLQGTRMLVLEFRQARRECAEGGKLERGLERGEQDARAHELGLVVLGLCPIVSAGFL